MHPCNMTLAAVNDDADLVREKKIPCNPDHSAKFLLSIALFDLWLKVPGPGIGLMTDACKMISR